MEQMNKDPLPGLYLGDFRVIAEVIELKNSSSTCLDALLATSANITHYHVGSVNLTILKTLGYRVYDWDYINDPVIWCDWPVYQTVKQ